MVFVVNCVLLIRKLNWFFFYIKVLYICIYEKYEGKKIIKKLFVNEIYIILFVIRLFYLSGIFWDCYENEVNLFKVVICEKIKILI